MNKHELRDANIRTIIGFGIGLFVLIVFALFAMDRLFDYLAVRPEPGPRPSPLALTREIPPQPRLQVAAPKDLKQFLSAEDKVLNSYGWVDQNAGIVRIPIDRAMDLLAKKGLPARSATNEEQKR
jgi:hypothetical protein